MTDPTHASRWTSVLARDRAADGAFVYAVTTTGVYCRPVCPSRRPRPEHARFFDTPRDARAAGFRPCRRCEPDREAPGVPSLAVAAAARLIAEAVAAEGPAPSLDALAARAGYAPHHLHRLFKRETGLTPRAYAAALRARAAADGLDAGAGVTEALHAAGFSASRFYAAAGARLGMAPSVRRDGGRGETIRHAVAPTSLGLILVAATARGVCAIQFGDTPEDLVAWLRRRFPNAAFADADADFAALVAQAVDLVERPGRGGDLPLDLRGTAFQERVWRALRDIPRGATASYADVAAALGRPGAARGVATACAANAVAVAVPCHRVVRADGALSGYRWGVARKAALLAREKDG